MEQFVLRLAGYAERQIGLATDREADLLEQLDRLPATRKTNTQSTVASKKPTSGTPVKQLGTGRPSAPGKQDARHGQVEAEE
jgi:hypothetical protein